MGTATGVMQLHGNQQNNDLQSICDTFNSVTDTILGSGMLPAPEVIGQAGRFVVTEAGAGETQITYSFTPAGWLLHGMNAFKHPTAGFYVAIEYGRISNGQTGSGGYAHNAFNLRVFRTLDGGVPVEILSHRPFLGRLGGSNFRVPFVGLVGLKAYTSDSGFWVYSHALTAFGNFVTTAPSYFVNALPASMLAAAVSAAPDGSLVATLGQARWIWHDQGGAAIAMLAGSTPYPPAQNSSPWAYEDYYRCAQQVFCLPPDSYTWELRPEGSHCPMLDPAKDQLGNTLLTMRAQVMVNGAVYNPDACFVRAGSLTDGQVITLDIGEGARPYICCLGFGSGNVYRQGFYMTVPWETCTAILLPWEV